MPTQQGTIVEFNKLDGVGYIELDRGGGRVFFGGTSLTGDAALLRAGRPERARVSWAPGPGIGVVLLRERLVAGPLHFCSPVTPQ